MLSQPLDNRLTSAQDLRQRDGEFLPIFTRAAFLRTQGSKVSFEMQSVRS